MRPRAAWCVVAVGYAVAIVVVFWPVVSHGQMCGWDCIDEYWPDLVVQARAARAGEFPYWNPYTLGGYPFYADPQAGALTPINWLCTLLSFAIGVGPWLVELKVLLLFYAALLGTHLVVWRWTKSHWASAIAACTFVFGAPTLVHKNSAIVWPLLQLPWAVLALDAFAARPTLRRAGWLGLALAVVGTAHPQGAFYCALVLGPYAVVHIARRAWALVRDQRGTAARALLRAVASVAPGAVLALVIAGTWLALVYLPSWSIVADSARTHTGMAWATSNPLPPRALKELFVPELDASWMHDIYLGPLPLVLGLWLAAVRREARFWLVAAVLSVVLALGTEAWLLPVLVEHAPGFHLFRIAYRFKMITAFAAAALAGLGVGVLATTPPTRRHKLVLVALAAAWLIAALAIARTWRPWGLLVIAAFVAVVLDDARRRWWLVALALLVAVDLWRASATPLRILQPRPEVARGAELLARMPGIDREWRFHATRHAGTGGRLPVPYHASLVHGVRELSGFPQPLANRRVLDVLAAGQNAPGVLAHYNTKYFIGRAPRDASPIPGTSIRVAADVAPLARLYPRAELVPSPLIPGLLATRSPSRLAAALVDPADAPPPLPSEEFAPIDGVLVERSRTRLVFDIDAPAAGILVVNEVWSPHWRASVDGADVPVFRANYVLRALVVPAGRHRVELAFSAPLYRGSLVAGGLALLVLCGALASRWRVLDHRW